MRVNVKPKLQNKDAETMFNRELEFLERKHETERKTCQNRQEGELKSLRQRFGKKSSSTKTKNLH